MSTTLTLSASEYCIVSAVEGEQTSNDHTSGSFLSGTRYKPRYLCAKFNPPSNVYTNKKILSATLTLSGSVLSPAYSAGSFTAYRIVPPFNADTATYEALTINSAFSLGTYTTGGGAGTFTAENPIAADNAVYAISVGIAIKIDEQSTGNSASLNTNPTLTIVFGDNNELTVTGIYVDGKIKASRLNCAVSHSVKVTTASAGVSIDSPTLAGVSLNWRTATTAEPVSAQSASFTLHGNTIPSDLAAYQVAITDSFGGTASSQWIDCSAYASIIISRSPTDGMFMNRAIANIFSWALVEGASITELRLQKSGASAFSTYAIASGATSYTLAADTMIGGTYEWAIAGTDRYNQTYTSEWSSIDTTDAMPSAEPESPVGTVVDSDTDNTFSWRHTISTGTVQTRAELQKSSDNETWQTLVDITGAETATTIPANTLSTGTLYWRVRTYNLDDVPSEWGSSAQVLAIGSPPAPKITVTELSPRPSVAWQTTEQEAWELRLDGESFTYYGTDKSWKCPEYLADGTHTITLRTQNSYGRWGTTATVVVDISNVSGADISVAVATDGAVTNLSWHGSGYDFFLVYRDGKAIAKTTVQEYDDYLSCGRCIYQVRGCYTNSGNYGLSDLVEVDVYPPCPVIIDVSTKELLWLEFSEQQHYVYSASRSVQTANYHVAGRPLPTANVTEFADESLSLSCAFGTDEQAQQQQLLSLLGHTVCIKTNAGARVIGVLTSLNQSFQIFYTVYQFTVSNTDYEEEVSL